MGFAGRLATYLQKYERGANYELGNSLSTSAVSNLLGSGGDAINVLEEYNGFAWKCINIRAEMLADQDLYVERLVGNKWQEDVQHEFNAVLEGGEGQYDQSELLEAHEKSMCLYGESFWYYTKGATYGKPVSVYLLDPAYMTVMVADDRVTGYVYQKNGNRVVLDLDEVDYYRVHNPRNRWRGMGPMQAAGWFVRSGRYVTTYVNNFLENNAIPAGVIVAKNQVDDNDWKLFQDQWREKYCGINNSGKTGFVRGELDFVKTGLSLGEVDFEKVKDSSRDDVMIMFGISKPMMAIFDDINRASAVTARQLFALTLTSPALRRLKRKLSKNVAAWYGPEYRVGSTNPVPEDEDAELAKYDKLLGRAFTVNEVRAAYGKEPLPGGDELNPAVAAKPGTPPAAPAKAAKKLTIRLKNNAANFSYEMKESFRGQMQSVQEKYEQLFWQKSNKVLSEQKQMVLGQLMPKKIVATGFNADEEAKKLADEVLPLFILMAEEQGQLAASFAGNADTEFKLTPVMEKYIADSIRKSSQSFTEETQQLIATAVTDALNDGESVHSLSKFIDEIYKDVLGVKNPGYRSERLARTEVIKASNEITEAAYKQTGIVQKKEWFANPGCCQFCSSLDKSVIQLGSTFVPQGGSIEGTQGGTRLNDYEDVDHPPAHPACRCTLIPVIEEES